MKRGAVYQSYGQKYADQAAASARAARVTNPWLKTALFTEDVEYAKQHHHDAFDIIEALVIDDYSKEILDLLKLRNWLFAIKLMVAYRSPFDQTPLIDSDTVIIKDISAAFDLLSDFDLMLCHEVEHNFSEREGYHGLLDSRRQRFFNSGVMFYNSRNPHVIKFLKDWQEIQRSGDETLQRSDQDSLNYMISLPVEYMEHIRFSGTVLKTREYNTFCRYWREIWDAGQFSDVKIVHTFLADRIAPSIAETGAFDWKTLIEEREGDVGSYINRFTSSLSPKEKLAFGDTVRDRTVSIRQYKDYLRKKQGKSLAEDLSFLFSTAAEYSGFDIVRPLQMLIEQDLIPASAKVTQIGMQTDNGRMPLCNKASTFVPGNDLEYLAELFSADVTGISRSAFLGFKGRGVKTARAEYALPGNLQDALEPDQDLILDIDNSVPSPRRILNAIEAKRFLSPRGLYIIANLLPDVAQRMTEKLRDHFTASFDNGAIFLRHPEVAMPALALRYTPFSTARIALVGNCQASALASVLYRIKGVKIEAVVDVNAEGSDAYNHSVHAVAHNDIVDFCFSQSLSDSFGDIRSERLKKKYAGRYRQYTNLYFTGYHPDLTYYGGRGVRLQSAMGDYNSKIALVGFLQGLSIEETALHFNHNTYEKLGYYEQFEASRDELIRRDEANDVRFAEEFFEIAKRSLPLYTVNHPTAAVLAPLAALIVEAVGQDRPHISTELVRNPLVEGSVWPVYPEVAAELELRYPGEMTFYPGFHEGCPPMTLRDFIAVTFERYDNFGRQNILEMPSSAEWAQIELS